MLNMDLRSQLPEGLTGPTRTHWNVVCSIHVRGYSFDNYQGNASIHPYSYIFSLSSPNTYYPSEYSLLVHQWHTGFGRKLGSEQEGFSDIHISLPFLLALFCFLFLTCLFLFTFFLSLSTTDPHGIHCDYLTIRAHFTFKTTQSRYYCDSQCVFRVLWVLILVILSRSSRVVPYNLLGAS